MVHADLNAVVLGHRFGDQLAVVTLLGHPHVTARADHLIIAVVFRHAFGGAQGDRVGGQAPADAEWAVADIAAVAQAQGRDQVAVGCLADRQRQLQ
ncbi:hypothetical protein D3C87_1147500 [compost metagenome]